MRCGLLVAVRCRCSLMLPVCCCCCLLLPLSFVVCWCSLVWPRFGVLFSVVVCYVLFFG